MGRGRQKAKQQKIARKLKYLTTDTDYDELAKELNSQEPGTGSFDPFADVEEQYAHESGEGTKSESSPVDDDLDEYAKWAAEAAAKAASDEPPAQHTPVKPHKPIHMPLPSAMKPKPHPSDESAAK
ncbi:hypothetical protein CQR47_0036 [Bifidobacterium thermophilum]|jgi:hypothetical protein|uniref:DUF3073 domain-containing protein n=3 Tax=Bifidobacterium TaxID=1678 RepID=A0A2N3QPR4_9BIFI|nr:MULTISPECIES: DUF3073 domain-containing protein [Bifidobacterium]KFJ00669.1 hypothetical protein BPORC_1437 [Bifidobacterium porcinum]AGH40318.1 hypothetical protein D805_0051 [Bifidobacterium thermophilum RBL67]KFJ01914.1 hypothetical protein THER5_0092 [Bifidobacterium thermacidophilum subsp. thermacidophilum]MBM6981398.1 DUF3073 domain-containing protein [Bifidobacterium thermophilum]MDW8485789.1 DUF3073 domain-containing protein [Bifidobacterium thermophilum]